MRMSDRTERPGLKAGANVRNVAAGEFFFASITLESSKNRGRTTISD